MKYVQRLLIRQVVYMLKSLGQRFGNRKQKSKKLWDREFDIVAEGLDEKQVIDFIDNLIARRGDSKEVPTDALNSLIERAVADAEQIVSGIKAKAQDEAVKIIDQARQGADDIRGKTELAVEKEAGEIISALNKNSKAADAEAKQKTKLFLMRVRGEIEKEIRKEYKEAHSRLLYSLLGNSDEPAAAIKPIAPPKIEIEEVPDVVSREKTEQPVQLKEEPEEDVEGKEAEKEAKLAAREQDEKEAEEAREAKEAEKQEQKGMTLGARFSALRDKLNDKLSQPIGGTKEVAAPKPAAVNREEPEKQAEEEAKLAAREQAEREAEEAREAKEAEKQEQKGMTLVARLSAFRDKLNDKLSQPIGAKGGVAVPKPVEIKKEEPVEQIVDEEIPSKEEAEKSSQEKTKELMDLVYSEENSELPPQPVEETVEEIQEEPIPEEKPEPPVPAVEDAAATGQTEAGTGELPEQAEKSREPERVESFPALSKLDEEALYTGEIELTVTVPVNLVAVSKLYNYLQTMPDLKVLYTRGSWDRGTAIMVSLDKPLPLIGMISKIPGIDVAIDSLQDDSTIKGASASLLGAKKEELKRITLVLKER